MRDFVFDPINPNVLLDKIYKPTTFKEAVQVIKPGKPSPNLKKSLSEIIRTNQIKESILSPDAQQILAGLLAIYGDNVQKNVEESLFALEQHMMKQLITSNDFKNE